MYGVATVGRPALRESPLDEYLGFIVGSMLIQHFSFLIPKNLKLRFYAPNNHIATW